MRKLLLIVFLTTIFSATGQNSQIFLSEALDDHLPKYLLEVQTAIQNRQQDSIKNIFQTLVSEKLVGTYMDNVLAKSLSRKNKNLSSYKKPTLLITNPAWRIDCKGEQPALNELARKYGNELDIVMLYWGDVKTVKKLSKSYHRNIDILYVDDSDNNYSRIIKSLKHSLGLPLAFTLTEQKQVVGIKNRISNKMSLSIEDATKQNFDFYKVMIEKLLYEESKSYTVPTASLD